MTNYFYDLPNELQETIYHILHKTQYDELLGELMQDVYGSLGHFSGEGAYVTTHLNKRTGKYMDLLHDMTGVTLFNRVRSAFEPRCVFIEELWMRNKFIFVLKCMAFERRKQPLIDELLKNGYKAEDIRKSWTKKKLIHLLMKL